MREAASLQGPGSLDCILPLDAYVLVCSPELLYCQPDKHGSILVASSRVVVNMTRSRLGRLEGKDGMRQGSNKAYLFFCLVPAAVNCVNSSPKRSFFFPGPKQRQLRGYIGREFLLQATGSPDSE